MHQQVLILARNVTMICAIANYYHRSSRLAINNANPVLQYVLSNFFVCISNFSLTLEYFKPFCRLTVNIMIILDYAWYVVLSYNI